ncbi:3-deoxy-7-phosphoheptulonate synthase [Lactobacillus sp. B4026]|uniref:3-deoxy-7-phosphoheptulonate synthase n=1 Tax=Lactobacillus sp. B4026 TaxID=2818035 RepID=UPI00226B0C4F|nr:3-deoxy-7-phosphoheptulonate synthase [Lactobacillus sp. B4026]MCX8737308.1 3-deoxy-7-phosphoheptulonate synthase [Lactobacillus sp. B4026]
MFIKVNNKDYADAVAIITSELKKENLKFYTHNNVIAVFSSKVTKLPDDIDISIIEDNGVPYLASRILHPENTVIKTPHNKIGDGSFVFMGGPCSVESKEHILKMAKLIKNSGATVLRGGAFKPRTSPYSFQGLGIDGLKYMREAADKYGLDVITEVMDETNLPIVAKYADILQVGARNMQNFSLLKAIGKTNKPVALKRGMSATIDDLLNASEYIASEGNKNIMLVERGIRTFDNTYTRNTFDLAAVSVLKELTHYPIIVDPSHAVGVANLVTKLMLTGAATDADGEIVEVHDCPEKALSDGQQAVLPDDFDKAIKIALKLHNIYMG